MKVQSFLGKVFCIIFCFCRAEGELEGSRGSEERPEGEGLGLSDAGFGHSAAPPSLAQGPVSPSNKPTLNSERGMLPKARVS